MTRDCAPPGLSGLSAVEAEPLWRPHRHSPPFGWIWAPEFGWIAELSDPEMYAIASNLFAVRQTCRELLYQSERSPHLYSHPSQSACRLFSKAVKSLQKKYGAKFIFEPLDDSEGHSTTPSPGWLLALSDNVLKFIQVQERSEKA